MLGGSKLSDETWNFHFSNRRILIRTCDSVRNWRWSSVVAGTRSLHHCIEWVVLQRNKTVLASTWSFFMPDRRRRRVVSFMPRKGTRRACVTAYTQPLIWETPSDGKATNYVQQATSCTSTAYVWYLCSHQEKETCWCVVSRCVPKLCFQRRQQTAACVHTDTVCNITQQTLPRSHAQPFVWYGYGLRVHQH